MLWKEYYRPESVSEALEILARAQGGARLVAGATDLAVQLGRGELQVTSLVDVARIPGLDCIRRRGATIEIGARVTHAQAAASELLKEAVPVLAEACALVGSPQIRNAGTLAGNVVNAQPAADALLALLALEARLIVVGREGERQLPVAQACLAPGRSAIDPTRELVTRVELAWPSAGAGSAYERLSQRHALALPVVAVAAVVTVDGGPRRFGPTRLAIGPVAPVPFRAMAAERALEGAAVEGAAIKEAARLAAEEAMPRDSLRGSAAYRKHMVEVLVQRALARALTRVGADA